jgi:hypothetical protein
MGFVAYADKAQIMDQIMVQLELGRSLVQVCKEPGLPDRETISRWIRDEPGYAAKYAYARAMQADTLFSEMAEVEAKVQAGTMDSHAARVVLDSMRWRASKLAPKVYGDRLDVSVSDNRISISGALLAAQSRLALMHDASHVQDVQDVQAKPDQGGVAGPSD